MAGSAKIVFDEEGEAIDPLARLAAGAGSNGDEPATLEEHAAALRERMALADARDKADARKRRKEARETKRVRAGARKDAWRVFERRRNYSFSGWYVCLLEK